MSVNALTNTAPTGALLPPNNQGLIAPLVITSKDVQDQLMLKRAADGTALMAFSQGFAPPVLVSVVRNGAGDYTVTLAAGLTAAAIGALLTCNTAGLVGSVVITDATHLAVATKTDAGVATDSIFTLTILAP